MSDKLKVVGAKGLLNKPVLRVIRGDEAKSSPPTTPDPSWATDQMDLCVSFDNFERRNDVSMSGFERDCAGCDPDEDAIAMNSFANN